MNGNSLVHRTNLTGETKNLCKCGHEKSVHTESWITGSGQNKCSLCIGTTVSANNHFFESPFSLGPMPPRESFFTWTDIEGYYQAGGLGFRKVTTLALLINAGDTTITVQNAVGVVPGMSVYIEASPVYNSMTYTVTNVSGNVITLSEPALYANTSAGTVIFDGTFGSGMGPGRPRNGQRQG